jgi:hypothetical protein
MRLRDVTLGDLELYYRLRCDPVMSDLGVRFRGKVDERLARDVENTAADRAWTE